ncbi:MAG TPA: hypothetical protein VM841_00685 [Actinomycetota bacterium]|nr:hypothetical protein [Actinomycetota bacterium]
MRRVSLLLAAIMALSVQAPGLARSEILDLLSYKIHTVAEDAEGARVETSADAILLVPSLVDVDGDGIPDVAAQLQIDAARATLRVTKLPSARAELPLLIEAVLRDPRQGSPYRVAFGYDTLDSVAPAVYSATIFLAGAGRAASFSLDVETAVAGPTLAVIAEIFSEGSSGEREDPVRGRVSYAPVPTLSHFAGLVGSDFGVTQTSIDLTSNIDTTARVLLQSLEGTRDTRAEATIDPLPAGTMSLVLNDSPLGTRTWDYTATARVQSIDLRISDSRSDVLQSEFHLKIQDMALRATLVQDSPTHSVFRASDAIGLVEIGNATGGAIRWLDEQGHYLYTDDSGGVDSLAVRVLGLSEFELETGDPSLLDARLASGPLHVLTKQGTQTIDAWVRDLPSQFRIGFSSTQGTITYAGSAPIGELTVDATDPAGISGRATALHLLMRDIPTSMDLTFGDGGSAIGLDARGNTLGLIEVQLTSGPDDRLPESVDGILLNDLSSHYALFARVTGLRKVLVEQGPPPALQLNTVGGREFQIDLNTDKPGGRATTDAVIQILPTELSARFLSDTKFTYTASQPVALITIDAFDPDGIAGRATELHARLESLPTAVDVGFDADGTVSVDAKGSVLGLLEFQLSSIPNGDRIDAQFDGMLLRDIAGTGARYVVHARLTQIKRASAKAPNFSIDGLSTKIFKVDIERRPTATAKLEYLRVTLDHLVPNIVVSMVDVGGRSLMTYDAAQRTNGLTMESNSGDRWNMSTSIMPLPTHLDFCSANSGACSNRPASDTRPSGQSPSASSSIHASEHVTVNIFDCQRPLSASCTQSGASKYFLIQNWQVRFFEQEFGGSDSSGYIWENTTDHGPGCAATPQQSDSGACHHRILGGTIRQRDESAGTGLEQTFGNGNFWADQRQGGWCAYIFSCNKKHYVNCSGGSLSVWLLNIKIGVSGYFC